MVAGLRAIAKAVESPPAPTGARASSRPYRRAGCGNGVKVRLLGHRQTKEAATDKPSLTLPRHISTGYGPTRDARPASSCVLGIGQGQAISGRCVAGLERLLRNKGRAPGLR